MARRLELYHGFRNLVTRIRPEIYYARSGAKDIKPFIVHFYPYGPRLRCPKETWIEVDSSKVINGAFKLCSRTPIKSYCDKYTTWLRDNGKITAVSKYENNKPTMWNNVRKSRGILFLAMYLGEYINVPQNGNRAGIVSCETFQFHDTTSMECILEFLELIEETNSFDSFPEYVSRIFHFVMKRCSYMRGNSLSKAFGIGEHGLEKYNRFMNLVVKMPGYKKDPYI